MSTDERVLRLENAFATLSELAARSQEVDARHETRLNSLEESNRRIAETNRELAESNRRTAETSRGLAESNRLIIEMIRRHDERVDEFRAARDETEHKLAALIDAQIRAEEGMEKLRAEQARAAQNIAELAEAQARTEAALERLSQTVEAILRERRGGQSPG